MRFEPIKRNGELIYNNEQFERFVKDFSIVGYVPCVDWLLCNNVKAVSKIIIGGTLRISKYDAISDYKLCIDGFRALLFDHSYVFKNKHGINIIVSFPYSTNELSAKAFVGLQTRMQDIDPDLRAIDMYFLLEKYKFVDSGDIGLMFTNWMYGKLCRNKLGKTYVDGRCRN